MAVSLSRPAAVDEASNAVVVRTPVFMVARVLTWQEYPEKLCWSSLVLGIRRLK